MIMRISRAGLIGVFMLLAPLAAFAAARCSASVADVRGAWGSARFSVEVATSKAERARGLMYRTHLAPDAGMLFVYRRPQPVAFWMKNTLIPLDMLFFDAGGRLVRIRANAVPGDLRPIYSWQPVALVLEINGGLAAKLGIGLGSQLRAPAVDQRFAAWPCR